VCTVHCTVHVAPCTLHDVPGTGTLHVARHVIGSDPPVIDPWLSASDASRLLRVNRATLYAYVSRGLVRSQARPGATRERQYSGDDIERLRRRTEERRDPAKAAARALHWGVPVLESSLTLIDGLRLYYRGHDAVVLARTRSVADVAALIWTGGFDTAVPRVSTAHLTSGAMRRLPSFVARAKGVLAEAAIRDAQAYDLRLPAVVATGWKIVTLLASVGANGKGSTTPVDRWLARAWGVGDRGQDVLRAALILCADHELNVSSFTARCVASASSNPYVVVMAGLAALEGPRHGGAAARVVSMLEAMRRTGHLDTAIAERLGRGETIEGFGHPLYRSGDPRATALMELMRERFARAPDLRYVEQFADAAASALRDKPNIDFALAALTRVLRLPPASPLTIFAIGRSIGWIGHAIEQYASGQLIRPRARYVGVVPASNI
jgi:citrate synthase